MTANPKVSIKLQRFHKGLQACLIRTLIMDFPGPETLQRTQDAAGLVPKGILFSSLCCRPYINTA